MSFCEGDMLSLHPDGGNSKKQKCPRLLSAGEAKAVIDIGSNSIKLRIVQKNGEILRTLLDTTEVVRLGKGIESGFLAEEPLAYGVEVVEKLVHMAKEVGASPRLVGTMALRVAMNAEVFVKRVYERTGIFIQILSGEEEARLAWLGAVYGLGVTQGNVAVFDTGGGSTEFILGTDGEIQQAKSIALGAVSLTETFFDADPVLPGSVEKAQQYIQDQLVLQGPNFSENTSNLTVLGLGGGVVALASVQLGLKTLIPKQLNGLLLKRSDIKKQIDLYASQTLAQRMKIPGLPPKRADLVLASACIVDCALAALGVDCFRASINGLRHGLLLEMFDVVH